ncbi:hypothetical protein M8494_10800 [Serratia ureilytica]
MPGIHGFRTQQDVENILQGTYAGQPVAVIGGGVLGVEAAAAGAAWNAGEPATSRHTSDGSAAG